MLGGRLADLHLPPTRLMVVVGVLGLVAVVIAAHLARQGPWLGVALAPTGGNGLEVVAVDPAGPAAGRLEPGDRVLAIAGGNGGPLPVAAYRPRLEPHTLTTFAAYNAYLERQGRLAAILAAGPVGLQLASGERITLRPAEARPLEALGWAFWFFHACGYAALMMGLAVWAFRRQQSAARLLALSGLGFFVATWFNSLYLTRELAIPEGLFRLYSVGNHLALTVLLGSALLLVIYYPRRLGGNWLPATVLLLLVGYQVNENLQWRDLPLHTFYLPVLLMYLAGIAFSLRQWQLSSQKPLDRAALKWVLLSVLVTMGTSFAVYFLPPVLGAPQLLSQEAMLFFAVLMYLGLALGVVRYRLFDLERWWFHAWLWFLGGLAVVVLDLALAWMLELGAGEMLGLTIILAGWLYFPLRQWLWTRISASSQPLVERQVPALVRSLIDAGEARASERQWRELLEATYQPLGMHRVEEAVGEPRVEGQGTRLRVPGLFAPGYRLDYADQGRRLFAERDVDQAHTLHLVAQRVLEARRAHEEGARKERQRIVRDLHDDVGARLLTLVHQSPDPAHAQYARDALKALRDAMRALEDEDQYPLAESLVDWRLEMEARTDAAGVPLAWRQAEVPGALILRSREFINLRRILDEAISNVIQHARPTECRVTVNWEPVPGRLQLVVENDGAACAPRSRPDRGRGLANMETRAREIGARIDFDCRTAREGGHFRLVLEWTPPASAP